MFGHVVCVGGCYGIASLYPIARGLKALGNRVTMVVEARSSYLLFWQQKLKAVSDQLVVITRDGSKGLPGHINQLPGILAGLPVPADRVILNGCNYLMMRGSRGDPPVGHSHHRQPEHVDDRRNRDVRRVPLHGGGIDQICLC